MNPRSPDWSALAVEAVKRLRAEYTVPEDPPDPASDTGDVDADADADALPDWGQDMRPLPTRKMSDRNAPASPNDAWAAASAALQVPFEEQAELQDAGDDPRARSRTRRACCPWSGSRPRSCSNLKRGYVAGFRSTVKR